MKCMLVTIFVLVSIISARTIDTLDRNKDSVMNVEADFRSPLKTGGISALIPGAGQIYTGHYIKAGAFLTLEVASALNARFWYTTMQSRKKEMALLRMESLVTNDSTQRIRADEEVFMNKFGYKRARYNMYNALAWMIGGYVYNILDAVNSTGCFKSSEKRDPLKAAWLAAIPGMGLGQFYNGEVSKAGMIMMIQASLAVIVVNEHYLMNKAQDNLNRIASMSDTTKRETITQLYQQDWESWRSNAFRNRNTYLWYSLFFYIYSICDAVVVAHLHDYQKKMRAYPDLIPTQQAFGLKVDYKF